jgi:DNA-binding Lrp family transcriptional regulator
MLTLRNRQLAGVPPPLLLPSRRRRARGPLGLSQRLKDILENVNKPTGNSVERQARKVEALRGAMMAVERTLGTSIKDIAGKYNCSPGAVKRYLDAAEESGLLEHFRALIYERLMGPALAVYEAQLQMGNLEAARDIVFGRGALMKNPPGRGAEQKPIDTLAAYRAERMVDVSPKETPVKGTQKSAN